MSQIKLCRICLNYGVKMYGYDLYHLKQYYEEITAVKVTQQDHFPHQFCYECAAMLIKFHKFKEKCTMGQQVLVEMLCSGPITLKSLAKVDKKACNLNSRLGIVRVSRRVRTCIVKSKSLKSNTRSKDTENRSSVNVIKEDNDDSLDIDLATYKNENLKKEKPIVQVIVSNKLEDIDIHLDEVEHEAENVNKNEIYDDVFTDTFDVRLDSDDEKPNCEVDVSKNDLDIVVEKPVAKKRKAKAKQNQSKPTKKKKFEIGQEIAKLDPKHWERVNLNEDEALKEFQARASNSKFLAAAFKCMKCYKGFSKEDMLVRHMKLRHDESLGSLLCRFCNMRFKRKCMLSVHIAHHYTRFKCLRCDLVCDMKNTALFHNDYHDGVIRKCEHCGREFKHVSTYYTHLRTHRSDHVCTVCGVSFVSAIGLGKHMRDMHVDVTPIPVEEEGSSYCEKCDVKFVTRQAYEQHLYHSAKHSDAVGPPRNLNVANSAPTDLNSKFKSKGFRRSQSKETPCKICDRVFPSYAAYKKHHKEQHKGTPSTINEERHICEICGISLKYSSVFAHLNTHTRKKQFSCATCGMTLTTKSSMQRHQLVHTGEKPYKCSLCEKCFTQQASLKLHYRTAHLKQPYPKRNRKKEIPPEDSLSGEEIFLKNFLRK